MSAEGVMLASTEGTTTGALPQIRFWGVRGSVPTPQTDHLGHGGKHAVFGAAHFK